MHPFWQACVEDFQHELSQHQFSTWIKPLRFEQEGDSFVLVAPNRFVLQWVKDRQLSKIELAAEKFFARPVMIELAMEEAEDALPAPTSADERSQMRDMGAQSAAQSESNSSSSPPTPATHRLLLERNPNASIRYIHAEQFVTDVVRAYQHKAFDTFKRSYHTLDLLLIDDIQFFGNKSRTQEEFFYAFNALIEGGKQVVITSDRFPKEISGIEDRLISRFGWGLTVSVEPPELEMRVAILMKKAESEDSPINEEVAFFIAKHIRSNIRELEGGLKRVLAYSRFNSVPVSIASAKEALKDLLAVLNRQISIDNIQKTVADYYKIKVAEMYSKKRVRSLARPRQIAMALAKELTPMSLPEIGEAFGGRDHTTVLHACRKVHELVEADHTVARDHSLLMQILRG